MSTTDTIIEFIGLCVFTTQLVNGNATARINPSAPVATRQVVAIMPIAPVSTTALSTSSSARAPRSRSAKAATTGASVEPHTAMIVFRSRDLLSVNGWAINKLDDQGWLYIKLSGDQVTFVPDATSAALTSTNNLLLAHLGPDALTQPYNPPYAGAAAVFTITSGTLSACANKSPTKTPAGQPAVPPRIDTTLTLHTINNLTITTVAGDKRLTLRAAAQIFAANVPLSFAKTGMSTTNAHMHYLVYCSMIGKATCDMPIPDPEPTASCDSPLMSPTSPSTALAKAGSHPPSSVQAVDFGCSNTQWP